MNMTNFKALILDDEYQLGEILVKTLKEENISAIAVTNVDSAIAKLREDKFDIVISDIYLPQKNGRDLFEYALNHFPELPFIFMTGNPDLNTAVDFLKKGAYDYLSKPFMVSDLIKKVHHVIQQSQERKAEKHLVNDLKEMLQHRAEDFRIYQDIFNSKEDGLLIMDIDGLIVRVNPGFCSMSGFSKNELQNAPFTKLGEIFPGINFRQILSTIDDRGHWKQEISTHRLNGTRWIANINFFPVRNENRDVFAYSAIVTDVTGLRSMENALIGAQEAIIFGLARLAEQRDQETGYHLERIRSYCRALALEMKNHPRYLPYITNSFIDTLDRTAPLHDIGKVGIPDHILLKGDKLTEDEYELMKQHTVVGYQTLSSIRKQFGEMDFLNMGIDVTYCHHERFDGTGYPRGLCGDEIPLSAQVVALADMYDALTSERVYKEAYPHDVTVQIIRDESGKHFDPDIIQVFECVADRFEQILQQFWKDGYAEKTPIFDAEKVLKN
ncbi:MAG: response regulator [Calditrichia bacterium]